MLYDNPFRSHTDKVELLTAAGIAAPAEWTTVRNRFAAFTEHPGSRAQQSLTDAIVNGTDADTGTLYALALAEASADPPTRAAVRNQVEAAVLTRLRELYRPSAVSNYLQAADTFDAIAAKLTAAAKAVNITADAETIVNANDKQRTAWTSALLAARELDATVPLLTAAAHLAGLTVNTVEATFALTIDPGNTTRRAAWTAHDTASGRCGKWAALLAAGCTIRAHRQLDAFEPYRRPAPMQEQWETVGRGRHRRVMVDPEEQQPEPPAAKRGPKLQVL